MRGRRAVSVLAGLLAVALLCGCGGPGGGGEALTWSDLLGQLTNRDLVARMDGPLTSILTSYDPAGSNDDYNHYVRKGPEGWIVLADLKGPGYVTRFWFTGADDGTHRVRFYFDGERKPRLDLTIDELCGGREPFLAPLAAYENYCWFTLVPMPYAKRLVIMTQEGGQREGGWPRIFYQVNYTTLPRGRGVSSFTGEVTGQDRARLDAVRSAWRSGGVGDPADGLAKVERTVALEPGARAAACEIAGPAILRRLSITPDCGAVSSAIERERILRDVVVRVRWNGRDEDSVAVPLGDFFGSFWRRTRFETMYFGLTGDTFVCSFPMPFEASASVALENQGKVPLEATVEALSEPLPAWDAGWGYFHAAWSRSLPNDVGRPHTILRTKGKGKYVGCVLGVATLDRSWWILEGDEKMYVDGETLPGWHGTGLEDYFNGGWYYQNVLVRPLHGLLFKTFFRIVQYRLHLVDPVGFNTSFDMIFERGPEHASHGWMESVAYYYQDEPASAPSTLGAAASREMPRDPLAEATVMTELMNHERFGDYRGARDYIDFFLETYTNFPFAPMLRLRQIAYVERMEGIEAARPLYEAFIASEKEGPAVEQAKLLLWFHASPTNALLSLYSNARARALLDGRTLCSTEKPDRVAVVGLSIEPGPHALAVQAGWQRYPSWVQACLRTHGGLVATEPDFRYRFNPSGAWSGAEYDDADWPVIGGTGVKGPPEEPYWWLEPNALVDMQAAAAGLRPKDEAWPDQRSTVVFRKKFDLP